jgi:hypothetical protein
MQLKRIEPNAAWMGGTGVNEHRIGGPGIMLPTVRLYDLDIEQVGEVASAAGGEFGIDFTGSNTPAGPNQLGKDRREITRTAADMYYMIPLLQLERFD